MPVLQLVYRYLLFKPWVTVLHLLLLALGTAVITVLLLFRRQVEERISSDSKGIDLVVGAKGSPLQIILCTVYHIDFPTGNIRLREAEKLAHHPLVKEAVPLSLGDSFRQFRIIGTNHDYASFFEARLSHGRWWKKEFEVVIGYAAAEELHLQIGDTFASEHGLDGGGHTHEENKFVVTGILKPAHAALDRLILTDLSSIWELHEITHHEEPEDTHTHEEIKKVETPHADEVSHQAAPDSIREITALLLRYRNPLAAVQLPRLINGRSNLQAASPAWEAARLFSMLGIGLRALDGIAYVLIAMAGLSLCVTLYHSLHERQYDLAILRAMGTSRDTLFACILLEGVTLTLGGTIAGLLAGHAVLTVLALFIEPGNSIFTSAVLYREEGWMVMASLLLGAICSGLPALRIYRVNVHQVLKSGA